MVMIRIKGMAVYSEAKLESIIRFIAMRILKKEERRCPSASLAGGRRARRMPRPHAGRPCEVATEGRR